MVILEECSSLAGMACASSTIPMVQRRELQLS
jgi:hypothetical protein